MHKCINVRPTLGISAGFRNNLVMAGIGSFAFSALAPQPLLAAPTLTLKGSFNGSNGAAPYAPLTPAGNGKFYGTTVAGGANGEGAIFEFDPSGSGSISLKASFSPWPEFANGAKPQAALIPSGNGITFYGTAEVGGPLYGGAGTIFEFDPSGSGSFTTKVSFDGTNGDRPQAPLTPAGNGKFYGTTARFAVGCGKIYEFDPTGSGSATLKAELNGANGCYPSSALTPSGNGTTFYGTASGGGVNGNGTIFEFDPTGSGSITRYVAFNGNKSNGSPNLAELTPSGNGISFYGTAQYGGAYDKGTIFEFDPRGSGSINLKYSFDGTAGSFPTAALTPAGNGKFYGAAEQGGANNFGTIFEFDPSNGAVTLMASFGYSIYDSGNGRWPHAALIPSGNGHSFYGTTRVGGATGAGAIFEFDPGTNSAPAPAPLPLLGAGAAFGWSRRLRRRIQPVRPVFPIGR
jgi:uncharacterized repeat protein (TIGR03803 family)